ncbi:MAG: hypothetical protein EOO08_05675 [Chitinophagaceae bacterium]|nr:MAG: hypothetical protein EOO08_05675 [Chitinophagaceae bacterium]
MKNTFFASLLVTGLLAVGMVGCAPLQQSTGDDGYYEPDTRTSNAPSRIYVEDPYRPGYQILVERDPMTGRYYRVPGSTYGGSYGTYDPYGRGAYRDPYYRPRSGGRGGYRTPAQRPQQQQPQVSDQRRQEEQRRQEAADQILRKKQ